MALQHNLKAGDTISNAELTAIFKCGPQGGMRRSLRTGSPIIISDHTKSIYEDCWASGDVIHYTGMGLEGDQSLDYVQNKTLYESSTNGVTPYLFQLYESGQYLFRGQIETSGEPFQETQPDKNGHPEKYGSCHSKL